MLLKTDTTAAQPSSAAESIQTSVKPATTHKKSQHAAAPAISASVAAVADQSRQHEAASQPALSNSAFPTYSTGSDVSGAPGAAGRGSISQGDVRHADSAKDMVNDESSPLDDQAGVNASQSSLKRRQSDASQNAAPAKKPKVRVMV